MTDTENIPALPEKWCWTTLGDISNLNPKLQNSEVSDNTEVSFLPMKCVQEKTGNFDLSITKKYSEVKKGYTYFTNGDIIFAKITPCMENGKVAVVNSLRNSLGFGSTEFHVIRLLSEEIEQKFVFFYLVREEFRRDAKRNMTGSAGQLRVPTNYLQEARIPLPPLAEQHRIVQRIEELFTDLDAGVKELEKAKVQVKNYRRAVLKAAVSGSLSKDWREEHKNELGCTSEENSSKKNELTEKNSKLPFIPAEWTWTTLTQIGELSRGKSKHRPRDDLVLYGGPYPFIQTGDVRGANGVLLQYNQTYSEKGLHQSRMWPKGTLCITIAANIADTALLGFDACFPDSIVGFISNTSICETKFIEYFFRTVKEDLDRYAPATAQKNINLKILSNLYISLPPVEEQKIIVSEIERRFSVVDQIEKTIDQSLSQAEKLRQSILKKAFEGKLVPQYPNDEPASVLLERIKQEKGRTENRKKPGKGRKVKAETKMEVSGKIKQAELF